MPAGRPRVTTASSARARSGNSSRRARPRCAARVRRLRRSRLRPARSRHSPAARRAGPTIDHEGGDDDAVDRPGGDPSSATVDRQQPPAVARQTADRHLVDDGRARDEPHDVAILDDQRVGTWHSSASSAWAIRWRASPCTGIATFGRTIWYMRTSSSRAGWPETWTKWSASVTISTPSRDSALCSRPIDFSLPGMMRDEKITTSPGLSSTFGWSSRAMRANAARGSPWLPVQIIRMRSRGI